MSNVEFVKGLELDKVYIFTFQKDKWTVEQVSEFFAMVKKLGIQGIGVYGEGLQILEPINIDKEKLKELLK